MSDRDDVDMRVWARHAFDDEPTDGSLGDTTQADLARAHTGLSRRRRWTVGASGTAAFAVGAILAVMTSVGITPSFDGSGHLDPSTGRTPSNSGSSPLDLGPLSDHEAQKVLNKCARAYGGADRFTIVTARRVDGLWGSQGALVAKDFDSGDILECTGDGSGGHLAADPPTDPQHPYRFSTSGGYESCDTQAAGRTVTIDEHAWLRVADQVQRVETRIGTDDRPGPWRVSWAHHGFAYAASWVEDLSFPHGASVSVMVRFFDADGNPLPADAPKEGTVLMASEMTSDDVPVIRLELAC